MMHKIDIDESLTKTLFHTFIFSRSVKILALTNIYDVNFG